MQARFGHDGLSDSEQAELASRRQFLRDDVYRKRSGN
jgi:hypothetical protein